MKKRVFSMITLLGMMVICLSFQLTVCAASDYSTLIIAGDQDFVIHESCSNGDYVGQIQYYSNLKPDITHVAYVAAGGDTSVFNVSPDGLITVASASSIVYDNNKAHHLVVRIEGLWKGYSVGADIKVKIAVLDDDKTIFVDPSASENGNGTIESPYNHLPGFSPYTKKNGIANMTNCLFKRGTTLELNHNFNVSGSNGLLGAYGQGDKPQLSLHMDRTNDKTKQTTSRIIVFNKCTDYTVRELCIGSSALFENEKADKKWPLNALIFMGSGFKNIRVVHNEIKHAWTGLYVCTYDSMPNSDGIEAAYNYVHDVREDGFFLKRIDNMNIYGNIIERVNYNYEFEGPSQDLAPGDCIQLAGSDKVRVHHNYLDRTDNGHKFCYINSPENSQFTDEFEYNYCVGNEKLGCLVYLIDGNFTVRNNVFTNCIRGVCTEGGKNSTIAVYGNSFSNISDIAFNHKGLDKAAIYNNTFYNNGVGVNVMSAPAAIQNNIFYLTQQDHKAINYYGTELNSDYNLFNLQKPANEGNHSITGDPAFADAETGNFILKSSSAAIDKGSYDIVKHIKQD
ncbi:MAG: right-handed parallel beta-helix repeat-containing protein, partial [Firmicutes bacterium]|nr:right-handed parallel beta-helix repeat-containing protein [Bacillota bacterium]